MEEKRYDFTDEEIALMSVPDIIKLFRGIRDDLDTMAETKTNLQKLYDHFRFGVLPARFEEEDIKKIDVSGIKVRLQDEIYTSIPADHKADAYRWLEEHDLGSIIKPTVNGSTLKATIRSMLKEGRPIPEELFKVTVMSGARFY